jgi:hypothetical protein
LLDDRPIEALAVLLDQVGGIQRVQSVVRTGMRQVGQLIQVFLPLPDVPVETLGQRVEPVGDLVLGADARHRIDRSRHSQTVKNRILQDTVTETASAPPPPSPKRPLSSEKYKKHTCHQALVPDGVGRRNRRTTKFEPPRLALSGKKTLV